MRYANELNIIEYPFVFENIRKRIPRRNIGFNSPIIIAMTDITFDNIMDAHQSFKDNKFSGLPMHFYIDKDLYIYKCRPTTYQNGYAEHEYISLDDYMKNAILIQVDSYAPIENLNKTLIDLCAYICQTEYLCPQTDIFDISEAFCAPKKDLLFDIEEIRDGVMNELYPDYNRNYKLLFDNNHSLIVIPDINPKYRTIKSISSVLAMSSDFDKWFSIANMIRRANPDLMNLLKGEYSEKTEDELLFVPISISTMIITPPCAFEYVKKSIIASRQADAGYKYIVNTNAEAAKNIFLEIKNNLK